MADEVKVVINVADQQAQDAFNRLVKAAENFGNAASKAAQKADDDFNKLNKTALGFSGTMELMSKGFAPVQKLEKSIEPVTQNIKNLDKETLSFTDNFNRGILRSVSSYNVFEGAIVATAVIGTLTAIKNTAEELFNVIVVNGVKSAEDYEDKLQSLDVALRNSGQFTNKLSKDFEDLAQSTQETTKYSDNMVLSATTQLQTLARLSGDGLKRATKDSVDLAAALRIDLVSASELVAKAHEGQTTALRRNGIVISENIPASEKYAALLNIIETRFGGTAQANATTYAAKIEILKNQFDDTTKQVGFFITKNEGVLAVMQVATGIIRDYTKELSGSKGATNILTESLVNLATIVSPLAQLADGFGRVFSSAFRIGEVAVQSCAIVVNRFFIATLQFATGTAQVLAKFFPAAFGEAADQITQFTNGMIKNTDALTKKTGENFKGILGAFEEDTALEKFAARAKKAAQDVQAAIAAQSAKPKELDQPKKGEDQTEAQRKLLEEERIKQAEITKLQADAGIERASQDAQYRIAVGEGRIEDLKLLQDFENQKIEITYQAELGKLEAIKEPGLRKLAAEKALQDKSIAQAKLETKSKIELRKQELADQDAFLNAAASLSNAKNKELAAIGKAASITQIAIKTPPAIASSFEFGTKLGGPPLGFVFGAIAATAMAAQAASIAGVKFEQGGFVPGLAQSGDNVQVRANPGEAYLNSAQQKEFMDIANGRKNNSNSDLLSALVDALKNQPIIITLNDRELGRGIRDLKAAGFAI